MTFEDILKVNPMGESRYDEDNNPITDDSEEAWLEFSKCFISFNTSAQKITLHDGKEYQYSYYVIAPLKKSIYDIIPKEGDMVRITKADGTVDKVMEVRGFVTYKKRYLKIWL